MRGSVTTQVPGDRLPRGQLQEAPFPSHVLPHKEASCGCSPTKWLNKGVLPISSKVPSELPKRNGTNGNTQGGRATVNDKQRPPATFRELRDRSPFRLLPTGVFRAASKLNSTRVLSPRPETRCRSDGTFFSRKGISNSPPGSRRAPPNL